MSVQAINPTPAFAQRIPLSSKGQDILEKLQHIHPGKRTKRDQNLKLLLQKTEISPVNIKHALEHFVQDMIKKGESEKLFEVLHQVAESMPLQKLEEATGIDDPITEAKQLSQKAEFYLKTIQDSQSSPLLSNLSEFLNRFISAIETFMNSFGIGDLLQPAESDIHAELRAQKVITLITLFSMLAGAAFSLLGQALGAVVMTATIVSVLAFSALWPLVKPMPSDLPFHAENVTNQISKGGRAASGVRKPSLNAIASLLKTGKHPILIGKSRVGKTFTSEAFAAAVNEGVYPELKGMQVFRLNTEHIIGPTASRLGAGNNPFKKISNAMGRHRNRIILVLDNIHLAYQNDEDTAEQLKHCLKQDGEFPHVIGITTQKEYDENLKDHEHFPVRFNPVLIEDTTESETLQVLSETAIKSKLHPIIEEGVIKKIYDKSIELRDEKPHPSAALTILKQCINRISTIQPSPAEERAIAISNELLALRSQSATHTTQLNDNRNRISELEEQLEKEEKVFTREQKKKEKLFQAKDSLVQARAAAYSSILKIAKISRRKLSIESKASIAESLILRTFLEPLLIEYIKGQSEKLNICSVIDEALVEDVCSEMA